MINRLFSVAPMMDCTDKHCRYFLRLISARALLYTEMITTGAIIHGDRQRLLGYHPAEHPLALQIGGSEVSHCVEAAKIAQEYGFAEVNLNVGCPSARVQSGRIGACLMRTPEVVAACVEGMRSAVSIPVTVKTRIGVDDLDDYQHLHHFTRQMVDAGCETIIFHARKAWLNGLSPKENREIPPLHYLTVQRLKLDFPELEVIINGGIENLPQVRQHLQFVDGVMLGRAVARNPYLLADVDQTLFAVDRAPRTRQDVIAAYTAYVRQQQRTSVTFSRLIRPILGLFRGVSGANAWRRFLSEHAHLRPEDSATIIEQAAKLVC